MTEYQRTEKPELAGYKPLPDMLLLGEYGEEYQRVGFNPEIEDPEFIPQGWRVRSYEGEERYHHKEKAEVLKWLSAMHYIDTGDGYHFRLKKAPIIALHSHHTDMKGTQYERRSFICTLIDEDGREMPFNIRIFAPDNRLEIEYRPPQEVDYDDLLEDDEHEEEGEY
jgi:hypothetical protein